MANADVAKLIAVLELKDLFSDRISKAERNLSKFESRSTKAGRQIGLGVLRGAAVATGAITAFGAVFAKGLSAASDLNETVSKTGVVFGKNAKEVLAFGHNSADAMGLSENAALAAASTYGNLFVSLGLTTNKAAKMSTSMVKLAGDLASFNNASPEDTLQAIQAGLVGETEPLRRYGINLNDATLRQEAMALGLTKTTKSVLPPAIKAQAAYSLILKQSGTAQGDFARTSGGMANQIRILKANFTDMLATLAAPALPGVAKIFQAINKEVKANQPAIAELGEAIGAMFSDENIKSGTEILKGALRTARETAPIVAASAKATFGLVQGAVGLFKSLPPEIQKLAVGAFAVNKLTGGLVTNIAGGIIDVVGKNFLQRGGTPANPLFVSDVTGAVGGATGAAAAGASKAGRVANALGKVFIVGAAIGVFAELKGILDDQSNRNKVQASGLTAQTTTFTKVAGVEEMKKSLAGIEGYERTLNGKVDAQSIAFAFNIDGVKDAVNEQKDVLRAAITEAEGKSAAMQVHATERAEAIASQKATAIKVATDKATMAVRRTEAAENRGTVATRNVGAKIEAARRAQVAATARTTAVLRAKRFAVNVSNVIKTAVSVSSRETSQTQTTYKKAYSFIS